MKKKILMSLMIIAIATPAFAVDYTGLTFSESGDTYTNSFTDYQPVIVDSAAADVEFTLSPNVGIAYNVTDNADGYTLVTANAQGTKAYGIQDDFQGILMTIDDAATDVAAPAIDGWVAADWSVMGAPDAPIPGEVVASDE